ncbi:DUF6083 domain-containing protein [Streptomyces sp. TLI_053]|uniref:DUF6083 domain-containing protein n=1 Tax=Streptomyces sp. TLI_053 TaxID=1855352 RepID=UPI001E61E3B3|nr:DUF6083 domain-containing protein [Streptomyces sp. TLI_053]
MTSRSFPPGLRWDGSRRGPQTSRALRIDPNSPTKALRSALMDTCRRCGNAIEWCYRVDNGHIPLHPAELSAARVPPSLRWYIAHGIAYPVGSDSPWCRIPHPDLCPATNPRPPADNLDGLRRTLALRTRSLIDLGLLPPPGPDDTPSANSGPARPVVHLLHTDYLAPGPVHTIRCVAQTRRRRRCPQPVDTPVPAGRWILLPLQGIPTTPAVTAVYHLADLSHSEQIRWRHQHCSLHRAGHAADVLPPQWQLFDATLHHQHIHPALPDTYHHRGTDA